MTDTPASSADTQKLNPTSATSATSTPPLGATELQEQTSTSPQTEISPGPQSATPPYSTKAPTPLELEAARAKAEALLKDEEPKNVLSPAEAKTTVMASGPDSSGDDEQKEPPEIETPQAPQEHAKKGSKALKVVGLVALVLVVGGGIGVGVTRLSSPAQTTETRSQAIQASGFIDNREIMPDMYRYLVQKYVAQDPAAPVDLSIKAVTISEPNTGISGSAYFKYDPKENLAFVFSRVTGLNSENETVPKLWIQRGSEYKLLGESEYILLGEMALTSEPEGTVGYFTAYYDDPTILAFDWLIVSYDSPEEEDVPQSIVAKVGTTLMSE